MRLETHQSCCPFPWCLSALFINSGPNSRLCVPQGKGLRFNPCLLICVNTIFLALSAKRKSCETKVKEGGFLFILFLNNEFRKMMYDLHRTMLIYKSTPCVFIIAEPDQPPRFELSVSPTEQPFS